MWIKSIESAMSSCGNVVTIPQIRALRIAKKYEKLLALKSTIFEDNPDIVSLYSKIDCGYIPTELECEVMLSKLQLIEIAYNATIPSIIVASGKWTRSGGNNYISVPGILATDLVIVTLTDQAATEAITKAKANASDSRIDLTFTGSPANTTTKADYFVFRPKA